LTTNDYIPTQHEHNSPHRLTAVNYVPAQHEHISLHRSMADDYIPAQLEHNNPHWSTTIWRQVGLESTIKHHWST